MDQNRDPDKHWASPGALLEALVMALRLYSRLPTGSLAHRAPVLDRIAPVLPLASLLIGLGPALLFALLLEFNLPPLFAAGLAVVTGLLATGVMAEDALADAADGLWGGATPERRLEIMKDSRHGTYGVAALCLLLLLRCAALAHLAGFGLWTAAALWLVNSTLARSAALALPMLLPPARSVGMAAAAGRLGGLPFGIGAALAATIMLLGGGWVAGHVAAVLAIVVVAAIALFWTALCRKLVGGQTGDLIGAAQALAELGAWATLLAAF